MHIPVVQRVLGLLLMLFSTSMLPPVLFSLYYDDGTALAFIYGFLVTLAAGFFIWLPVRQERQDLRLRDGFLIVAALWIVLGSFGRNTVQSAGRTVVGTLRWNHVSWCCRAVDDRHRKLSNHSGGTIFAVNGDQCGIARHSVQQVFLGITEQEGDGCMVDHGAIGSECDGRVGDRVLVEY